MQRDVTSAPGRNGLSATRREVLALAALGMSGVRPAMAAAPTGQLTYGVHISLAPTWFDPAETRRWSRLTCSTTRCMTRC